MIRPRPISQLSARARGLRPVPDTRRTTVRYTPPARTHWAGLVLPAERARRRDRGHRQKLARRAGRR